MSSIKADPGDEVLVPVDRFRLIVGRWLAGFETAEEGYRELEAASPVKADAWRKRLSDDATGGRRGWFTSLRLDAGDVDEFLTAAALTHLWHTELRDLLPPGARASDEEFDETCAACGRWVDWSRSDRGVRVGRPGAALFCPAPRPPIDADVAIQHLPAGLSGAGLPASSRGAGWLGDDDRSRHRWRWIPRLAPVRLPAGSGTTCDLCGQPGDGRHAERRAQPAVATTSRSSATTSSSRSRSPRRSISSITWRPRPVPPTTSGVRSRR